MVFKTLMKKKNKEKNMRDYFSELGSNVYVPVF